VDRGLKELVALDYAWMEARSGHPNTDYRGSKLAMLQSPYLDRRRIGLTAVLDDAHRMTDGGHADLHARRARRRLRTLGQPSMRTRETAAGLRFGPHCAWVPLTVLAKPAELTVTEWQVVMGLCAFWQARELCYPRQAILARLLRCHRKRVARALAGLKKKGHVLTQQRLNHSAVYRPGPTLRALEGCVLLSEVTPEQLQAHAAQLEAEAAHRAAEAELVAQKWELVDAFDRYIDSLLDPHGSGRQSRPAAQPPARPMTPRRRGPGTIAQPGSPSPEVDISAVPEGPVSTPAAPVPP
jgi:hypothetical protein